MARNLIKNEQLKIDHKNSCVVATTANITISTALNPGDTLDSITLSQDDRVLVKDQSIGSQNGIYVVDAMPFRALDFDGDAFVAQGTNVKISEGTVNAKSAWILTTANPITVDTTSQTWELFVASGATPGEINTASNVGVDKEVFKQKAGVDFEFRTLKAGTNVTITQNVNDIEIASSGGGGTTINQFSSIKPPQLFNPDVTAVTNNTDAYTLSGSQDIAFVTINGQTLDDSEYSLVTTTLTVIPDNGFNSTSDEVLIFQHDFASTSGTGTVLTYVAKTATYTVTTGDFIVDCTANTFTVTLPIASGNTGQQFIIKNSGTGLITVDGNASETIDDQTFQTLKAKDSMTVVSNGSNFIIV